MQERKEVHRSGGGMRHAAVFAGALLVLIIAGRPAPCGAGCSGRGLDWIKSGIPAGRIGLLSNPCGDRFAGLISTLENPYLIEGLVSSNLFAGFGTRSFSAWFGWAHLGNELYREDRMSAPFGFELPVDGFGCIVVPAVERRAVKGFTPWHSHSLHLSTSYEFGRAARIAFEGSLYESASRAPRDAALSLELRSACLAVAVDRIFSGVLEGDMGLAIEVRLDETCSLLSGYRSKTDEILSGLILRRSRLVFCLSWSQNPVLGSSLGAVVGRVWKW